MSDDEKQPREPGCPSCAAVGHDCGGHWNAGRRRKPAVRDLRGRITLDVIDDDGDHDAFYREDSEN
jgi:hypothetical protein